jgi:hypothetical protein
MGHLARADHALPNAADQGVLEFVNRKRASSRAEMLRGIAYA